MADHPNNQREHQRYETSIDAFFERIYPVKHKVDYQHVPPPPEKPSETRYPATTSNVSAQGLCLLSERRLQIGDTIALSAVLPKSNENIKMTGQVQWCRMVNPHRSQRGDFSTGVKVETIDGKKVLDTIVYDPTLKIFWSDILEKLVGKSLATSS